MLAWASPQRHFHRNWIIFFVVVVPLKAFLAGHVSFFFFLSYSRPGLHSHIRHPLAPTAGPRRSGERDGRTVQPICFPVGKASCVLFIRRTFSDKSRRMRACRHNYADPVSRFYGLISASVLFAITRQWQIYCEDHCHLQPLYSTAQRLIIGLH